MEAVKDKQHYFYKITAFWAGSECFLGGMLHAIRLPVSGLLLGSLAVLYCALISYRVGSRQLWKATVIVLIIKASLSPHTPVAAYIAVAFQGAIAALLLNKIHYFRLRVVLLGIIVLLQSALQKLIVLTIIYGMAFWQAAEEFLVFIAQKFGIDNLKALPYVLSIYLSIYFVMGIAVGIWAGKKAVSNNNIIKFNSNNSYIIHERKSNGKKNVHLIPFILWVGLLILYFAQEWLFQNPIIQQEIPGMLLRAFILIGFWYWVASPFFRYVILIFLNNRGKHLTKELDYTMQLLPQIKAEMVALWHSLSHIPKWKRGLIYCKEIPRQLIF